MTVILPKKEGVKLWRRRYWNLWLLLHCLSHYANPCFLFCLESSFCFEMRTVVLKRWSKDIWFLGNSPKDSWQPGALLHWFCLSVFSEWVDHINWKARKQSHPAPDLLTPVAKASYCPVPLLSFWCFVECLPVTWC